MNVKIDTKEKFTVITPINELISANMTEDLALLLQSYSDKAIPHVILNMENVRTITKETAVKIFSIQQRFYEKRCSFVICKLNEEIKRLLEENELLTEMNITATETEGWDIVQMEEIERELMADADGDETE